MCGGRGTRLDAPTEKPLYELDGRPMLAYVLDALDESRVETVYAVGSPHAPETRAHVLDNYADGNGDGAVRSVDAPGDGYVADLDYALEDERITPPVLSVAADLPLLAGDAVDRVLDEYADGSLAVCVPASLKRILGASVDTTFDHDGLTVAPTGVNVVGETDDDTVHMTHDIRFALNVNRPEDARLAEALL